MSFLVAAYAALWVGIFAYGLRLAARLRALEDEARRLRRAAEPEEHSLARSVEATRQAPRASGTRS